MNQIPQEIIDRILDVSDIVSIIGEDISLRRQGVNYIGLCPFHNEKTPSFVVSPSKKICKCFSCGKGGNVITYLQEKNGWSFPEAVRVLGKRYNIEIPSVELTPDQQEHYNEKASAMVAITEAFNLYRDNLERSPEALTYLSERKISKETYIAYGLGYTFDYDGLSRKMLEKGFNQKYLISSGISYMDEDKGRIRDCFWQRILFPFFDKKGQVVGFSGRTVTDKQAAKYKNTGDTILFNKGHNIFGLFQARTAIQKVDKVYIVEGQFDVLSMAQIGVNNVVGGSGTAFTEDQRRMLHGITSNVVFIYDGDAAGINAAKKNIPPFVHDEFRVKCIRLPEGKDPDEMVRLKGPKFAEWIKKHELTYVEFLSKSLFLEDDDDYQRLDKTKDILHVIVQECESVLREKFYGELAISSGYGLERIKQLADEIQIPEAPEKFTAGFYGEELAKDYIDSEDKCINLTGNFEKFQTNVGERKPYLFYSGVPNVGDIQKLAHMAERVIVHSPVMDCNERHENSDCLMMKEIFKFGMTVDVIKNDQTSGFIYAYVQYYSSLIDDANITPEIKNEYITRCAEMISFTKQSIQTINLSNWAKILGLTIQSLKEILKPFNNERKSKQRIEKEREDIYDELQYVDSEKIPDYVSQSEEYSKMLRRYGFYPLLNKEGMPVCYMFKTENNSYKRVGDFFIEPLFHVYSTDKNENRRVIKLNRLYVNKPTYVEWPSSIFAKLTTLQEMLINEGAFNFENGDARDYMKIWTYISYNFPKCTEIKVYGQQEEGCFLFSNGIFHQVEGSWKFEYSDELGLMRDGDALFYSPSFSKINTSTRKDDDKYEQDRWLVYTDTPVEKRTTFKRWAELMNEVYRINDNGKWALVYAIMCAFRSDIYPINRLFTSLFFIGPTMSGKTQIAVSVRSLFIKPEAPSFNLNSGTDAAFFSVLERFRDVPQIFEEYNDEMISDNKFQGLKSVTYDGDGKQKRKAATGNDIETSKVNAPVIILGQEAPQKDDNALANRVVLCEVPKSEEINSDQAQQLFRELKGFEKAGLSYLLVDILKMRPIVKRKFAETLRECSKELQGYIERAAGTRSGDQTRIINTVSIFLTMVKIILTYAPELKLPFTYKEFLDSAVDKIKKQVELLVKTDKLAMFFNSVDYLIDKGSLKYGRDFKIDQPEKITLKGGEEKVFAPGTSLLFMNISNVHKMYLAAMSNGDRPLSLTTLEVNLKSHPSYVGNVSNTRFKYLESKEVPIGGQYTAADGELKENMTLMRVMEKKEKMTSAVVLNYNILQKVMNIDFERYNRDDDQQQNKKDPVPDSEQDLPF
jgi:DNA primase catalytic core